MLFLFCVALWFIQRALHVLKSSRALCPRVLSFLLALWSPCLGKRELVCVFLMHLFVCFVHVLSFVVFVIFLFLLVLGVGCGLWLWHSLDLSINFLTYNNVSKRNRQPGKQCRPWSDCSWNLIWVYTVCPGLSVQKLGNITVIFLSVLLGGCSDCWTTRKQESGNIRRWRCAEISTVMVCCRTSMRPVSSRLARTRMVRFSHKVAHYKRGS